MVAFPVVDDVPDPFFSALMAGVDCLELAQIVERPAWMADALCIEYRDRVDFFPKRGEPTDPARAVCAACLCRLDCLTFALDGHDVGMWAGTSEKQRRHARRQGWTAEELLAEVEGRCYRPR